MRLEIKSKPDHRTFKEGKKCKFTLNCNGKLVKGLNGEGGGGYMI